MRNVLAAALLSTAALMMISSAATATTTCEPSGLAGRWNSYTLGSAGTEPFWERCDLRFNRSGKLLSGSTCHTDTNERSVFSGRLTLSSDCQVTGTLTQQFPGEPPNVCRMVQATLAKGQQVLSGVGTCKSSKSIFSFTMIRR